VRRNFLEYGHPDGKQTVSIGLALPAWIIDSHNNIWVLGFYGILFGGLLPYFVVCTLHHLRWHPNESLTCHAQGRWWFGSRSRTKDGVQAATASRFFKEVTEEVTPQDLLQTLSKGLETERGELLKSRTTDAFKSVEKQVLEAWSAHGVSVEELYRSADKTPLSDKAIEAYILLSAHLFRISVPTPLRKGVSG
jgi:translocation protein SEC63